jgi:metal-responsive CopG/Arc/MetJ family transcriptional regulator
LYIIGGLVRTLIDIPEEDLKLLNEVAKKLSVSRSELVRRAVATSLAPHRQKMNHAAFGAWSEFPEDGLAYQERMRAEW